MTAAQVELEEGKCTGLLKNKHLDLEEGSLIIISCKIRWEVYTRVCFGTAWRMDVVGVLLCNF